MELKPLEVYSEDSNYGIVRMPGRNYPGCVIQGDSLACLCATARRIVDDIKARSICDRELLGDVEDLYHSLLGRLLDYQEVIQRAGFKLPYGRPMSTEDFIRPTASPETEEPSP